jgi:hypothetical protein
LRSAISVFGTAPYVLSQSSNASIDGEITDPNGAMVQGAHVVLISKDTKGSSTFVSDANGHYTFRNVLPGAYKLSVTAQSFGEYVQDGILVRVGYPIRQNVQLTLETTTQRVEVNADASPLNFENAELRGSIDPQVIEEVPLLVAGSMRSAANFASLLPGVARGSGDAAGAHVNGGQSQTGIVVLDGVALYNSSGTQGLTGAILDFPQSPDLISEFQVLTGAGCAFAATTAVWRRNFHRVPSNPIILRICTVPRRRHFQWVALAIRLIPRPSSVQPLVETSARAM